MFTFVGNLVCVQENHRCRYYKFVVSLNEKRDQALVSDRQFHLIQTILDMPVAAN